MIKAENIGKVYKTGNVETAVLKNISFKISRGEFVAIMGPSGSGKSTLMHILGCLDKPSSGKYFLDNEDVSGLSNDKLAEIRKRKIGFVFQQFNLMPRMDVLKNTALPLIYAGVKQKQREEKARRALLSVGLEEEYFDHLSNQLSGGQMQRAAIARALVNEPEIILADEPTGNLDTKTGEIVLSTFQTLNQEQGKTIILITHEQFIAERAKRVIHIVDGELKSDEKL